MPGMEKHVKPKGLETINKKLEALLDMNHEHRIIITVKLNKKQTPPPILQLSLHKGS